MKQCYLSPNEQPSKVYSEVNKHFGKDVAEKVFMNIHSNEFIEWFGDWRNMSEELINSQDGDVNHILKRDQYGLSNITNEKTNEPKVFYMTNPNKEFNNDDLDYEYKEALIELISNLESDDSSKISLMFNLPDLKNKIFFKSTYDEELDGVQWDLKQEYGNILNAVYGDKFDLTKLGKGKELDKTNFLHEIDKLDESRAFFYQVADDEDYIDVIEAIGIRSLSLSIEDNIDQFDNINDHLLSEQKRLKQIANEIIDYKRTSDTGERSNFGIGISSSKILEYINDDIVKIKNVNIDTFEFKDIKEQDEDDLAMLVAEFIVSIDNKNYTIPINLFDIDTNEKLTYYDVMVTLFEEIQSTDDYINAYNNRINEAEIRYNEKIKNIKDKLEIIKSLNEEDLSYILNHGVNDLKKQISSYFDKMSNYNEGDFYISSDLSTSVRVSHNAVTAEELQDFTKNKNLGMNVDALLEQFPTDDKLKLDAIKAFPEFIEALNSLTELEDKITIEEEYLEDTIDNIDRGYNNSTFEELTGIKNEINRMKDEILIINDKISILYDRVQPLKDVISESTFKSIIEMYNVSSENKEIAEQMLNAIKEDIYSTSDDVISAIELSETYQEGSIPVFLKDNNIVNSTPSEAKINNLSTFKHDDKIYSLNGDDVVDAVELTYEGKYALNTPLNVVNEKIKSEIYRALVNDLPVTYDKNSFKDDLLGLYKPYLEKAYPSNRASILYLLDLPNNEEGIIKATNYIKENFNSIDYNTLDGQTLIDGFLTYVKNQAVELSMSGSKLKPENIKSIDSIIEKLEKDYNNGLARYTGKLSFLFEEKQEIQKMLNNDYKIDSNLDDDLELGAPSAKEYSIEESVTEHSNKVEFDDSIATDEDGNIIYNPHTGTPMTNHEYRYKDTGDKIQTSGTKVLSDYDELRFEKVEHFIDKIVGKNGFDLNIEDIIDAPVFSKFKEDASYSKYNEDYHKPVFYEFNDDGSVNEEKSLEKVRAFVDALIKGDINSYFKEYPLEKEFNKLAIFYPPQKTNETDEEYKERILKSARIKLQAIWQEGSLTLREWEGRAIVGTKFHRMAEAIFKEVENRNPKDDQILLRLSKLEDELNDVEMRIKKLYEDNIAEFKDTSAKPETADDYMNLMKLYVGDARSFSDKFVSDYYKLNAKHNEVKSSIQLRDELTEIKNHIKSKGGRILTEVIIHTDKLKEIDSNDHLTMAGQIDVLAIYEDKEGVDEDYRGTVEIYDFKTTKWGISNTSNFYKDETNFFTGYTPQNQAKHATQLLLYKRILEEELGLSVKNEYIIQINIPRINTADYSFSGPFGLVSTDFGNDEDHTKFVINIKKFKGFNPSGKSKHSRYPGYKEIQKRIEERIPYSDTSESTYNKNENEGERKFREKQEERQNNKMDNLINDLQKYIQKRIDKLRLSKDDTSEQRKKLAKLQTELSTLSDVKKLWRFAYDAIDEILGDKKKDIKGLVEEFKDTITEYYQNRNESGINDLRDAIANMDRIRTRIEGLDILDRIRQMIDENSNDSDIKRLMKLDDFKRLETAVAAKNKLKEEFYDVAIEMIAERLAMYASKNVEEAAKEHFGAIMKRRDGNIINLRNQIKELEKSGNGTQEQLASMRNTLAKAEKKLEGLDKNLTRFVVNKQSIMAELKQLPNDIGVFQRYVLAPITTSDTVLSLYAKMLKFSINDAEVKVQNKGVQMQLFLDSFLDKLGDSYLSRKQEEFYKPIVEEVNMWITESVLNPDTGEIEPKRVLKPVSALVSEYGTILHKLADGTEAELGYQDIIKDYQYRMKKLRQEGDIKEYRKVKEEFKNWMRKYMQPEFTSEYYEMEDLLTKDDIGRDAKNLLDDIDEQIAEIKDEALEDISNEFPMGRNDMYLTDDELKMIRKLKSDRKKLSSIFKDEDGVIMKEGRELEIALRIQEHNKMFRELHESKINNDLFEYKRKEIINEIQESNARLGLEMNALEDPRYYKWLNENEDVVLTDKFWNKYKLLKLKSDLVYYAAYHDHPSLISFINSSKISRMNDVDAVIEIYNKLDEMELKQEFEYELENSNSDAIDQVRAHNDKINKLLSPYKVNGIVQIDLVPNEVTNVVRSIEMQIQDLMNNLGREFKRLPDGMKKKLEAARDAQMAYKLELNEFVMYAETNEYKLALAENKAKAEEEGVNPVTTAWYKKNHYFNKKEKRYVPLRMWTYMTHRGSEDNKIKSNEYYSILQDERKTLMLQNKGKSEEWINNQLKKTPWYKKHHDEDGDLLETSEYYLEKDTDNVFVERVPSAKYNKPKVKEDYIRKGEGVRDKNGKLLPRKEMWVNKKYLDLKNNNPTMFELHQKLLEFYTDAQDQLPEKFQMGNILPFIRKGRKEITMNTKGAINKGKAIIKNIKENSIFSDIASDVDEEGDRTQSNLSLDDKFVPMPYTKDYYIPIDETSNDVISSIMVFLKEAYKHNAVDGIMAETRTLSSLIEYRESEEGGGVIKTDSLGNKYLDALSKKIGVNEYIRKSGESLASGLFKDFVQMQIFGELRKPHEVSIPWYDKIVGGTNRKLRLDKITDMAMTWASITQIGGINISGAMKGIANGLMAEIQLAVETSATRYYSKGAWKNAKYKTLRITKDALADFGKAFATTLTGQLSDIYDPMQGEFIDKYGKKIAGSRANKLLSMDTWFFNQYIGEWNVAMMGLYAMLSSYKIVNGEVYSKDDYLAHKAKEKGLEGYSQLSEMERAEIISEFDGIKETLAEAYVIGEDGVITIKEGVNWEIGSHRDKEMKARMHSINKSLHGVYNSFDQPVIQRTWLGRLLMMYKKYLFPALRRRFGALQKDEELGDITYGYYRNFIKLMITDTNALFKETLLNSILPITTFGRLGGQTETGLSSIEKANVKRATKEMMVMFALALLVMALAPGDDEDKDEVAGLRWLAMYEAERLRKEISSLTPTFGALADNWKLFRSPSAIAGTMDRWIRFGAQLADPWAVYQRDSGIAEKGDNKLLIKGWKLLGNLVDATTIREGYENLNKFI